jgi:phosphate transport system permease protein
MAAATRRIARLKRADRAAVFVITLGGLSVIASVLGILLFIGAEAVPMFRSAAVRPQPAIRLATPASTELRAAGLDEYQRQLFMVEPDARLVFYDLADGSVSLEFPIPGLEPGTPVVSSSRSLIGNLIAAGTSDGRVALAQVRYVPRYEDQQLAGLDVSVRARGLATVDPSGRAIRQVSYDEHDGYLLVAAIVGDTDIGLWRAPDDASDGVAAMVQVPAGEQLTQVRVGRHGAVVAATRDGRLFHWIFAGDVPELTDVIEGDGAGITALEFLIGGNSVVVGTARGHVTSWFRATLPDGGETMVRGHEFEPQGASVVAFAPSPRDRSFAAAGVDGSVVLRHQTSERTLARAAGAGVPRRLVMAPKADAVYVVHDDVVAPIASDNPHPEVSWRALFGKVWYEGYHEPAYAWQSTGGTDDFEPKLSLMPLIFGTIKGTLYAMLFAIPIAVLGALYTSQFVHPALKAKIKPTVEIMAALPSVVIGFLAGLYLAGVVERHLVAVFVMMVLLPLFGTSGALLWRLVPRGLASRLKAGTEIVLILPLLLLAAWLSVQAGPTVEQWLFAGDARAWLQDSWGLTYDQRNCLVVGIAMGFAVIPIIFTISEDAFTSVPSSLSAASLALGASRWQTAVRVVLPTASPGVFSAVMIGFGRAVGETMIVLMATGNTPVMEWSIFNGIRTLSANIAVEIPEAHHGGTLYRTLFLAAALLFVMTFVINTVAEIIRQRLRERYKAA